jgi:hypothetical protein
MARVPTRAAALTWRGETSSIAYLSVARLDLMNSDGTNSEELPVPYELGEIPTSSAWAPGGRRLALSMLTLWGGTAGTEVLYVAGACGNS